MTEFTLRPLIYDDLEWLRCLRNANRYAFFQTDEITPEQQFLWWVGHDRLVGDQHWVIEEAKRKECSSCGGKGRAGFFTCPDCKSKGSHLVGVKTIGYFAFVRPNPVLPIFAMAPLKGHVKYLNSLLLEQAYHRQGIMTAAVKSKLNDAISYCGYVRENNTPSLHTCLKIGLKHMGKFYHADYGRMHVLWRG